VSFAQTNNCTSIAVNRLLHGERDLLPTAGGARTGTLTVVSNANNSPTIATLSGTRHRQHHQHRRGDSGVREFEQWHVRAGEPH